MRGLIQAAAACKTGAGSHISEKIKLQRRNLNMVNVQTPDVLVQ